MRKDEGDSRTNAFLEKPKRRGLKSGNLQSKKARNQSTKVELQAEMILKVYESNKVLCIRVQMRVDFK